jgi:hypothetical protein
MRMMFACLAAACMLLVAAEQVGHEYRQDDWPSITAAPDGTLWLAWLSFAGDRDDVAIRPYKDGKWGTLQWVPGASGDNWMPQAGVDGKGRVWVVWAQQAGANWDIYARAFDPAVNSWGALERLTSDPLPDTNPRLAARGGILALVWQGFRGKNSNIFLRIFDGERWAPEIRVTNRAANDWEPAAAIDGKGAVWVTYDSYRNGNYDVYLARVSGAQADPEVAVAATPKLEVRATVAVDTADRVWVAWESGPQNWGKDQGYIIRKRQTGALLEGARQPRIRCYQNGQWKEPPYPKTLDNGNATQPHVFSDGMGSVWLAAKLRRNITPPGESRDGYMPNFQRGNWEYAVAHLGSGGWSEAVALEKSRGRLSTRLSAASLAGGGLAMAWPADYRAEGQMNRPMRQEVFSEMLAAPAGGSPPPLSDPKEETVIPVAGHKDEAGDLKVLRAHAAKWSGRTLRIVRGDFHRHTELSWDVGGAFDGSLQDFYRYMIDAAAMDFGASTDHQGGLWPYAWWYTQKMTDMYHVPGAYTPIFGYERSASYPNGHRNMFFAKRSDARVTPFFLKPGTPAFALPRGPFGDEPQGSGSLVENDTKLLYEQIRKLGAIAISHTSSNNMGTDWRDNDPDLEPVVEIFQGCRTSSEAAGAPYAANEKEDAAHTKLNGYRPDGMMSNAWGKGYKLGIIAASDHFSTHISYALVYTDDFTRQGILDAIRKRHTYGATDNIVLEVRMGEHLMGDEFVMTKPLPMRIVARGTGGIATVDVIKDGKVIYSAAPEKQTVEFTHVDRGDISGRHYYYVRLLQKDGMIAWSSPMFVNYR